jgi:hypothetical protein
MADRRGCGAPNACGDGIPDRGRKIVEEAADRSVSEPFVPQANIEGFDRVGDRASRKPQKCVKRHWHHVRERRITYLLRPRDYVIAVDGSRRRVHVRRRATKN